METSRRDLFIDVIFDRFTLNNNQITLSPCFTFIPKTWDYVRHRLVYTVLFQAKRLPFRVSPRVGMI